MGLSLQNNQNLSFKMDLDFLDNFGKEIFNLDPITLRTAKAL